MQKHSGFRPLYFNAFLCIVFLLCTSESNAAGFGIIENGASGLGNAYAGAAASAEDASTIYFNPAGMTYLGDKQAVVAVHAMLPSGGFQNTGSVAAFGKPLGNENEEANGAQLLPPTAYYAMRISPDVHIGIGFTSPFGLKTDYDKEWIGRYQTVQTELLTFNINPSIAYKVNDVLSIGAGLSAMYAKAELTRAVNFGIPADGGIKVEGDDWSYGYNFGAMLQVTPNDRIGLAYRSKIEQQLKGDITFSRPTGIPAVVAPDSKGSADITLPESIMLSSMDHIAEKWDLLTDITWTRWSRFKDLTVQRDNGGILFSAPQNWQNTMRYSIGANYQYNPNIKLRIGAAYDESTLKDDNARTARIPDNDRKWLTIGANYKISESTKLDIGYAHFFIKESKVDDDQNPQNGHLIGTYNTKLDIVSLQLTYDF
ncbi:OmpP1/FadL family transporter [Methylovorus sp. MM2]|uniref:OmpP1/FadL family transporter n=1 Tax=Methylovorus sp. MM2 TaxID=1848038 RepID=UPI0009EDC84A|nr:outer membrane protein transport protein [Methylovorus sp. MM2]